MCRNYYNRYTSCSHRVRHQYGNFYPCPDIGNPTLCPGDTDFHLSLPGHCTTCLLDIRANLTANGFPSTEFETLNTIWQKRLRGVLHLAAAPGMRYRIFGIRGQAYTYDIQDDDAFGGEMSLLDAGFIAMLNKRIPSYFMLRIPGQPEPSKEQWRFFEQLRFVELCAAEFKAERNWGRFRGISNRALWERVLKVRKPLRVGDRKLACSVCSRVMPAMYHGDFGLEMPCGHVVAKECLDGWISQWAPGNRFNVYPVCRGPMCRENSSLLSEIEQVHGIDGIDRLRKLATKPLLPAGAWLWVLQDAWKEPIRV